MEDNKNIFYIVGTPIGNLGDISERCLKTLKEVDFIFAEDTRVTRKITSHFNIDAQIRRYNENNPEKDFEKISEILKEGKSIALVTDAGTPAISDPGFKLVDFVRENIPQVKIRVIPGPSAIVSALSVSGLPSSEFTFLGYPPAKKKRKKFFEKVASMEVRPVVLYESPHRLQKTFSELEEVTGDIDIFVAKEMTKIYESYFKGKISEARDYFLDEKGKGEFVIIIQ